MIGEREPTYNLARRNPDKFKVRTLKHLARASVHGAQIWNYTLDRGVVEYAKLTVNPNTWVSNSRATGGIALGAQPMDAATKERIHFHGERFPYADEVSYRLLHEATHSFLYTTQHSTATRSLLRTVIDVRGMSEGRRGLTALGSLDFYKGDAKQIEDTTELMTMYAWSPEYAREFTDFLAHPDYKSVRRDVGWQI